MERIILTKRSAMLIGVFLGLPIGGLLVLSIMGITQSPIENLRVMQFGDITISSIIQKVTNNRFAEELVMTKNGRLFLSAQRNARGELTDLTLADGRENIILTLKPSPEPGKWMSAHYGSSDLIGESYYDSDFNGHFDIKMILDAESKVQSRHIYVQHVWKLIDRFENQKAISGSDTFVFYMNSGWQLDETGKNREHSTIEELQYDK